MRIMYLDSVALLVILTLSKFLYDINRDRLLGVEARVQRMPAVLLGARDHLTTKYRPCGLLWGRSLEHCRGVGDADFLGWSPLAISWHFITDEPICR